MDKLMKKFSFPKNMVRADVFLQVLWQFLSAQRSFDFWISRGDFLAAFGGEIGSNYFKNTAPLKTAKEPVEKHRRACPPLEGTIF